MVAKGNIRKTILPPSIMIAGFVEITPNMGVVVPMPTLLISCESFKYTLLQCTSCDVNMAELKLKIVIPDELEKEMEKFKENWPEVALEAIKLRLLRRKLESKEEKESTKWSIELGRKINKGAFNRLLSALSPKEREKLIGK